MKPVPAVEYRLHRGNRETPMRRIDTARRSAAIVLLLSVLVPTSGGSQGTPVSSPPANLRQRIQPLVDGAVARSAVSSIQIVELETGAVVASRDANVPIIPASNMKLFTTAAGLDLLEQPFHFTTTVSILGTVDRTGTLRGDVKIAGGGDPTFGSRFHEGKASAVIEEWIRELKRAGIRSIDGNVIFEHGYFDDQWVHPTWPEDQLVYWYEAPISALAIQEGCVLVRVLPGQPGGKAVVELEPPNRFVTLENSCVTGGRPGGVYVGRKMGTNTIIVKGNVPAKAGPTEIYVTVMYPVHYFAHVVHEALKRHQVSLSGEPLLVGRDPRPGWQTVTITRTPLTVVNYVINKKSQNFYAEQLIKTIGAEIEGEGSWEAGARAIERWMSQELGVAGREISIVDGSGMSRENRASAAAFVAVLRRMWASPYRWEFVSSMPYSGEDDSRLRRRMNAAPYARSVYAKTGYLSGVIGLSGYVRAQSGRVYAFSFLFNRYRTGVWGVYNLQDEILKEIIRNG